MASSAGMAAQDKPIAVNAGGTLAGRMVALTGDVGVGLVTLNGGTLATFGGWRPRHWGIVRRFGRMPGDKLLVTANSTVSASDAKFMQYGCGHRGVGGHGPQLHRHDRCIPAAVPVATCRATAP